MAVPDPRESPPSTCGSDPLVDAAIMQSSDAIGLTALNLVPLNS